MMTRSLALLGTSLLVVVATACGGGSDSDGGSCGDNHVTGSETCDDGNTTSGDGCSASCQTEGGCGDGTLDVATEQCDDGNMTSGDGCSSQCDKEGTCGNGFLEPGETCDDNNVDIGDGCNALCAVESGYTCTGTPSTCTTDGNNNGGGDNTCASPGVISLTASGPDLVGSVSGDTTSSTNEVDGATCDGFASGYGNDQTWTFTTTDVRDVLIVVTPDFELDATLRLMSTACDVSTELIDQVGEDGCSDSGYEGDYEVLGYVNLPPGTYYVVVDAYDEFYAGTYDLDITASVPSCGDGSLGQLEFCDDGNMTDGDGCTHCTVDTGYHCDTSEPSVCAMDACGDGIIQGAEECDDGDTDPDDGCDGSCLVETGWNCEGEPSDCVMQGCGDGIVDDNEECDDRNTMSGDRCSATCVLEQDVTESEPNDTTPQALSAGSHIIRGAFETDDVDLYTFTLAATSDVEIETYYTIDGDFTSASYAGVGTNTRFDCPDSDSDTQLALYADGDDVTDDDAAIALDDDDGDFFCSYLGKYDGNGDTTELVMLPAGTYTLRLKQSDFATTIPAGTRYMLDLKITPMGSAAVAPGPGDLVINEFLAADGGATTTPMGLDSNCDGNFTDSSDEFIELVNVSANTLDLTGVTYADADATSQGLVKFTFAPQATGSLTLAPGKAVVLWGGGTPSCPGVTNFFVNGTFKSLSLNDDGDTITIATGGASPMTIATTTYAAGDIVKGKSSNLSPDITGTSYVRHDMLNGVTTPASPGKKADGSAF
jgi:cysteine-rich repeat protein